MMERFVVHSLLWGLLMVSNVTLAESVWDETLIIAGLDVGHKSHNLEQLLDTRLNFYMVGGNIQTTYQDYYLALNLSQSIAETKISEDGETGTAERSDLDVILGWNVKNNVTLFAGYKRGKTKLDVLTREAENSSDDLQTSFSSRFKETGPYVGVAYTYRFPQSGQLTFSVAYAMLNAENHLETDNAGADEAENANNEDPLDFDDLEGDFSNDANGSSFGIKWSTPVTKNVYYTALFRINIYQQSITGELDGINRVFDVDEIFIDMNFGFLYIF